MELHERIPNNVNLATNPKLKRALEKWQPSYFDWWMEMGPKKFQNEEVYLRTTVSVEADGWTHYDYVKMPEYRWGIFLTPMDANRKIGFGDNQGKPVWQEVPGEFRNQLRRLIVTQGDTEPASVEQQRSLGSTAPSLYDLRNLFQINVEEARHLWSMVYLLHSYFGSDGRDDAEDLLSRRSGDADKPRMLGAFNEPCNDWLNFFMFTMFADRDGKYQLLALSESGFDPLARATKFMLREEGFHMSVGESGIGRIVERTVDLMRIHGEDNVRENGGIDLPTIQKYLNFWVSLSSDLFGGEVSSNAAVYFATGLKGRHAEDRYKDHQCLNNFYRMKLVVQGKLVDQDVPMRHAMNEVLRNDYLGECRRGVIRWNRILEDAGITSQFSLPNRRFFRKVGSYADYYFNPSGDLISGEEWQRKKDDWLPNDGDRNFIKSLMSPVYEPGKIANWIAPPKSGVKGLPLDFEYVRNI